MTEQAMMELSLIDVWLIVMAAIVAGGGCYVLGVQMGRKIVSKAEREAIADWNRRAPGEDSEDHPSGTPFPPRFSCTARAVITKVRDYVPSGVGDDEPETDDDARRALR